MPPRTATANALLARLSTDRGAALSSQVPGAGLGTSGLGGYPAFGGMSPAVSQQYDYLAGRPVAASALPRNVQDFLAGAFGPTVPMAPMPIDLPQPGQERPDPRRFQYPVGYNLPGIPGSEGLKLASFANLRAFADIYSVARSCINVRENELLGVEWDIVPTDDAAIAMREDSSKAEDFQKRVREAVAFFRRPDPAYKSYIEWMRALLEDVFVIDAASLYLQPPKLDGYGILKSNLKELQVINGEMIKPLVDIRGGPPRPPNPAFHQYAYGIPRRELMDVIVSEELELDGEPIAQYAGDQLLYLRHQPRSFTPYGLSVVEQCILPISIGVKGQTYTLQFYTEGTLPDTFVQDGRAGATPQQSYQLQEMLNSTAGDTAYRRKVFVLPFGSRPFPMKPQALTGGLAQEYAEYTCMVIDVSPQEVGLSPGGGRGGGLGGKGFTEQQENATFRKSLKPMLMWLKVEIFDFVLQTVLGQADMTWKWKGFEPAEDLEKKNAILVAKRNAGFISTDEGRAELGLDPFGTEYTSVPYVVTASGMINLEDGSVIAISGGGATQLGPDTALGPDGKPLPPNSPAPTGSGNETPLHEAADEIDQRKPVSSSAGKAAKPDTTQQHTGVMVALIPPTDVASLIALPDGEAPEELHVTLAYLGDADKLPDSTALLVAMRAFAQAHAPVQATLNGIGRFIPSGEDSYDEGTPIIVNVDSPSLPDLRSALVNLLTRIGCPPVLNHGFSPHLTLQYLEDDSAPTPTFPLPAALPVVFSTLRVAIGGEVHDYPLSGSLKVATASAQTPTTDATDTDTARTLASSYLAPNAVMTLLTSPIARSHKRSRNREE